MHTAPATRVVALILALPLAGLAGCATTRGAPPAVTPLALAGAGMRFAEQGVGGALVLLTPTDPGDAASTPRALVVQRGDDARVRMIPASTFKIPNTLIGLDTGAVGMDHRFAWDGVPRRVHDWDRDLLLPDAFRASCVPCYQELARLIGLERMRQGVLALGYGNAEIGEAVDAFWLEGPLAISLEEQAEFVRRLYLDRLPFARAHIELVKAAMFVEAGEGYRLFAKTGWSDRGDPNVGWYVGWVETPGGPHFFATRVLVPRDQPGIMRTVRKSVTLDLLRDLGAIPPR